MPQEEGKTDYKYEDYASAVAVNRLPQTAALVNQTMKITLDSGTSFELEFVDRHKVIWQSDNERGTDWCEVVEVASQTYFIDMTFTHQIVSRKPLSLTFKHGKCSRSALLCAKAMSAKNPGRSMSSCPVCSVIRQFRPRGASRRQRVI